MSSPPWSERFAPSPAVVPVVASLAMRPWTRGEGRLLAVLEGSYRPVLHWTLRRRAAVTSAFVLALVAALALVPQIGREFLPQLDEGTIVIQLEKSASISLARSLEIDDAVGRALLESPEVVGIASRVGSDELRLDPMGLHETDCFLLTRPRVEWTVDSVEELHERLRAAIDRFPGVRYGFTQPIDMRVSEMLTGVTAAFGGTFSSTLLTLVFLPMAYAWLERRHEARARRAAGGR